MLAVTAPASVQETHEILYFVDDLAVAELHYAHRVSQSLLARDCVFGSQEIPASENPLDPELRWLAGMMTSATPAPRFHPRSHGTHPAHQREMRCCTARAG